MPLDRAQRLLVIAPHADDEVIGCGGTIARASDEGTLIDVAYLGVGNEALPTAVRAAPVTGPRPPSRVRPISCDVRREEARTALSVLAEGAWSCVICPGSEGILDAVPLVSIVAALDEVLGRVAVPTVVLAPTPSSHQDHVVAYRAARALVRRRRLSNVVGLLCYEYGLERLSEDGGLLYVDIETTAARKTRALIAYASEMATRHPMDPLSPETAELRARARGREVGLRIAEAFRVEWMTW